MAEVIDFNKAKANQGGTMQGKKPTARQLEERITMLENLVGGMQAGLQNISQELFHINANSVALFRAVEAKGVITEDDIKESWSKHIQKPYEEDVAKAQQEATASTTGQDLNDDVMDDNGNCNQNCKYFDVKGEDLERICRKEGNTLVQNTTGYIATCKQEDTSQGDSEQVNTETKTDK